MLRVVVRTRILGMVALAAVASILAGCGGGDASDAESEDAFLDEIRQGAGLATSDGIQSATAAPESKYPKIELETQFFEMGVIANDRLAHSEMKIYNRGGAPLRITKITTSCGCTVGKMRNSIIPPGGEGILEITVDPARVPGFYTVKTLTIFNDDPLNPYPQVDVATHVEPEVEFEPKAFELGDLDHGKGAEVVIRARQLQAALMQFDGVQVRGDSPYLVAELEEVPEEEWRDPKKREYLIRAKLSEDAPPGTYKEVIYISTNLPRHKSVSLSFEASVIGLYNLSTDHIALRGVTPGQLYENVLTVRSRESLEISEVTNTNEAVQVTHRPGEEPNSYVFDVMLDEGYETRLQRDQWTLELKTGGQEFTETVDVSLVLKRKG